MASLRRILSERGNIRDKAAAIKSVLGDIDESPSLIRWFRLLANRGHLLYAAIDLAGEIEALEKKDGMHDKLRRSLQLAVTALGGPSLDWKRQKAKKGEDDD